MVIKSGEQSLYFSFRKMSPPPHMLHSSCPLALATQREPVLSQGQEARATKGRKAAFHASSRFLIFYNFHILLFPAELLDTRVAAFTHILLRRASRVLVIYLVFQTPTRGEKSCTLIRWHVTWTAFCLLKPPLVIM